MSHKPDSKFGIVWGQKLGRDECPYLIRWVVNLKLFSIRVHYWISSDDDRALHDHPWWFITLLLRGSYIDIGEKSQDVLKRGSMRFRRALHRHTVKVLERGTVTVMLTGPYCRSWGFYVGDKFLVTRQYFKKFGKHPCQM
jgi:hypothetical protein